MSTNLKKTGPFDVKMIEALAAVMTEHDLSEVLLREGQQQVRLRRGGAAPMVVPAAHPSLPAHPAVPAPAGKPAADAVGSAPSGKKNLVEIKSETVGIFYAQSKPGDPPYVKVGDRVKPDTVVGVVVVMKTNNEITANCSGVIVEVLVKNEQSIDFNQPLFRVDPS